MNFNLFKKYWCPPLPLARVLKRAQLFTRSLFERYPLIDENNSISCDPLFIISAGRSGTTLMRSMLVASGQIAIPAETQNIHSLVIKFPLLSRLGWLDLTHAVISDFEGSHNFPLWESDISPAYKAAAEIPVNERSLARIIDEVYKAYEADKFPDAKMWGDQSPVYTFFLPYIRKVFPNAKYLHMLRDGRDVISSVVKRRGPDNLQEGVYRWKESIKRVEKFSNDIRPDQIMEVRYENLVGDPETTLKDVCNFINIKYSNKMLEFWHLPTTVEDKYYSFHKNLSKPVFSSSVGAWKERLTEDQISYMLPRVSKELEKYGYLTD